jgi:hypothetical protein
MNPNVEYCTTFPEDANFGAHYDSFSYRLAGSCIANPEYEPEDMRKAVLHAISSTTSSPCPLLVIFILPAWENSPWRTQSILSHPNTTILIHLQANQLKFVPTHKQLDAHLDISRLRPADWPVDIVMVANKAGHQAYLNQDRLQHILIPGILQACQDPTQTITLFPLANPQAQSPYLTLCPIPHRPLPRLRPANINNLEQLQQPPFKLNTHNDPNLIDPTNKTPLPTQPPSNLTPTHLDEFKIPNRPLTILEIYGGTAAGLEALLRTGHHIQKYILANTNPDTHTSTKHRLAQLQQQYPTQLPLSSITQWDNLLPLEPTLITANNISAAFPEGIDILVTRLPNYTPPTATKPTITNPQERAIKHII